MADGWESPPDFVNGQLVPESQLDLLSKLLTTGVMVPIQEVVVAGVAQSTMDFNPIPQTFRDLQLIYTGRASGVVTTEVAVGLYMNNITSNIYRWQMSSVNGVTQAHTEGLSVTSIRAGSIPGGGSSADHGGGAVIDILNYAQAVFTKPVFWKGEAEMGATHVRQEGSGSCITVTPINRLTLISLTDAFAVGSRATLYGRPKMV